MARDDIAVELLRSTKEVLCAIIQRIRAGYWFSGDDDRAVLDEEKLKRAAQSIYSALQEVAGGP